MAPQVPVQNISPAELSYLHASIATIPPIRPDLRSATAFRPLTAETDFLPAANGSARVCFNDGTEAVCGVKAQVERTERHKDASLRGDASLHNTTVDDSDVDTSRLSSSAWLEVTVDLPGYRDDDPLPSFVASMLSEALLASTSLRAALYINPRWHWKLYIDIVMLSPPRSYPLPLLSMTVHLALRDACLPRRTSPPEDDPMWDDDWASAVPLYARSNTSLRGVAVERPPVTLLVETVGENVIFDPSNEELAVADCLIAVSIASSSSEGGSAHAAHRTRLLAIRTIEPPSRTTMPGVPNAANPAALQSANPAHENQLSAETLEQITLVERDKKTVWSPPRGGIKRGLLAKVIKMVVEPGGVGDEVLDGLAAVQT